MEISLNWLASLLISISIASVLGTYLSLRIARYWGKSTLIHIAKDERVREAAKDFLIDVLDRVEKEYVRPKIEEIEGFLLGDHDLPKL